VSGWGTRRYAEVMEQFALVVDTNRTAPAVIADHGPRPPGPDRRPAGRRPRPGLVRTPAMAQGAPTRRPQSCWHRPRLRSTP
jgi:hypothetical protein